MINNGITSDMYISGVVRINSDAWIKNTKYVLPSSAIIEFPESSIICDGELIDGLVGEFGAPVVVQEIQKNFVDEYGNPEITTIDRRLKAIVQRYTIRDFEVREGVFKSGEIVFTFTRENEPYVKPGYLIFYQGERFQVSEVLKQSLAQTVYYLQVKVMKY
jgi:hypothetical protein